MTAAGNFSRSVFSVVIVFNILLSVSVTDVYALISEPDNILYGILPDASSEISLVIDEELIATYTRGDNPAAGDYFVLRVPIDAIDPQLPNTFRANTEGELFLDAAITPEQTIVLREPGTVQRIVLPNTPSDTDLDSVEDNEDNCPDTYNVDQDDANGDGDGDACDGNSDTDRDGYTDMQEYMNFHDGILDPEGYGFDPTIANAPGGEGFTGPHPSKLLPPILFLLLGDDSYDT